MTNARITATLQNQCRRVVLRLASPEAGVLSIRSLDVRDPMAPARAIEWMESAEDMVRTGAIDVLYVDPDGAAVLSENFGV